MTFNARLVPVDAEQLLLQVDRRLRLKPRGRSDGAVTFYSGLVYGQGRVSRNRVESSAATGLEDEGEARIQALERSLECEYGAAVDRMGEAPPPVGSLRGKAGGFAIRILRALLWWYTRSLQSFGASAVSYSHQELELLSYLSSELADTRAEIAELREEVRRLREAASRSGPAL